MPIRILAFVCFLIGLYGCASTGETALIGEVAQGDKQGVIKLLENGAKVNETDAFLGNTPLIYAVRNNNHELVALLIENGADVNTKNNQEDTALQLASQFGYFDIADTLIRSGAEIDAGAYIGRPALVRAAASNHTKLMTLLLAKGASVNVEDDLHNSSLMIASLKGNLSAVSLLIESGGDANKTNQYGQTAIFFASLGGFDSIVEKLLSHGANPHIITTAGRNSLHAASIGKNDSIIQMLFDEKTEPVMLNNDQISAEDDFAMGYSNAQYGEMLGKKVGNTRSKEYYQLAADHFQSAGTKFKAISDEYSDKMLKQQLRIVLSFALIAVSNSYQAPVNAGATAGTLAPGISNNGIMSLNELRERFNQRHLDCVVLAESYRTKAAGL